MTTVIEVPATSSSEATDSHRIVSDRVDGPRLTFRDAGSVLAYGATLLLIGLGSARVLTYHETLFAQPAKEMLATGDWIIPRFVDVPSNHKPPLTHWSIALSMLLFGSTAEWVVRLPAVAAGLGTALLTALLAARAGGSRLGLLTGLVQLTTFYTLMQARLAESDMLLCFWVTAALVSLGLSRAQMSFPRQQLLAVAFHAATAAAFLTKGPIGVIFIAGGALGLAVWQRERAVWRVLLDPAGLALLVIGVLAWPIAAYLQHPGIVEDWRQHHLGRFAGSLGGEKPPFFYWYMTPLLLLPWTPAVIYGGRQEWTERGQVLDQRLFRLLVSWFGVGFAVLSLSSFQHKHYLIPILPPFSILGAIGLERYFWQPLRLRSGRQVAALFAGVWVVAVAVQCLAIPQFDSYRDQVVFARRINRTIPDVPLVIVGLLENQIAYYLRPPLVRVDDLQELPSRLANRSEETFVLAPRRCAPALEQLGSVREIDRCATIRKIMTEDERLTLFRVVSGEW